MTASFRLSTSNVRIFANWQKPLLKIANYKMKIASERSV